jgi:hypothetical protein
MQCNTGDIGTTRYLLAIRLDAVGPTPYMSQWRSWTLRLKKVEDKC